MTTRERALAGALLLLLLAFGFVSAAWWQATRQPVQQPSQVDIGFAQAMSRHHQQAVGMAQLMLDGRPTSLAALARQIAATQQIELGEMQGWLKLWGAQLMPLKPPMDWMLLGRKPPDDVLRQYLLDCAAAPTGMAGLASPAEVGRLRTLQGQARDAHFLTLMLAHHNGGLPMARFAAAEAGLAVVGLLAGNVVREQQHEIFLMRRAQQAIAVSAPVERELGLAAEHPP